MDRLKRGDLTLDHKEKAYYWCIGLSTKQDRLSLCVWPYHNCKGEVFWRFVAAQDQGCFIHNSSIGPERESRVEARVLSTQEAL
ncbi:hypothetical protein Bca4012_000782 [Brassica carinata]